jgi:hypothetical protein
MSARTMWRECPGRYRALITIAILMAVVATPNAHVLDQYLQATRIALLPNRVDLELDLTPGLEIAPAIFLSINTNRDGEISAGEAETYAKQVLGSLVLAIDGRRQGLALLDYAYPTYAEMRAGTGTIRLRATSRVRLDLPGQHRLVYRNQHEAERSAYLANTLVPPVREIAITNLRRDPLQREIRVDYTVTASGQAAGAESGLRLWSLVFGLWSLVSGP